MWFIWLAFLYLLLGVCLTTVNMVEAAPSPGPPSIATAVTQVILAPPAIIVSRFMVHPQWKGQKSRNTNVIFRKYPAWGRYFLFMNSTCIC